MAEGRGRKLRLPWLTSVIRNQTSRGRTFFHAACLSSDSPSAFCLLPSDLQPGGSMRLTLITLVFLLAATAFATGDSVAIHSKHVLDVRSGTSSEAYVVVRGDRIVSIDKSAPKGAPPSATISATASTGSSSWPREESPMP